MNRAYTYFLAILMLAVPVTGCNAQSEAPASQATAPVAGQHREEGEKAVSAVIEAYKSNFPGALDALVSQDYAPDRLAVINAAEEGSIGKTILNIDYTIDQSILKDDRLAVTFDWNRTFIPAGSASQTMDSGTTSFVFAKEGDRWMLIRTSGSNFF
jgi:hypothetical protein